jgi:hypothetical protein
MTRLEALERVAEAAKAWGDAYQSDEGATTDHRIAILYALRDLDALPPPQPPGETVEALAVEVAALRAELNRVIWRLNQIQ